jgi:hypothetical protein
MRAHLTRLLDWHDAHVTFDSAVADIPEDLRGTTPAGAPYSPWQLVEHLRLAQHDILDFCVSPAYTEMTWPDDYWPALPAPPTDVAWDASIAAYRRDRDAVKRLVQDPGIDLSARIPHGTGQTFLRQVLLIADHAAYHVGQLVLVRRLLGAWPGSGAG